MMINKNILLAAFCAFAAAVFAQNPPNYIMGLPDEPDTEYDKIEVKAKLTNKNYRDVSSSASVKSYAPTPQSQGQFGTCAAWAVGFAARTILEAKRYGWTDKNKIKENIFAYGFLYRTGSTNQQCWGAFTSELVDNMKTIGIPKLSDYSTHCPQDDLPEEAYEAAKKYKIKGYAKLWDEYVNKEDKEKIDAMKKSLSEGNPVVISMICPQSFFSPTNGVWYPKANEALHDQHGRHAMCVVGYDDDQLGGAFEIQNSWGEEWGNGGYVWVKYQDFVQYVYQAYELHQFETVNPNTDISLSGSLRLQLDNGQEMKANLKADKTFEVDRAFRSGTRFRIYIGNDEPAYVYAFGVDGTAKTYQVFPHKPNISPALTYKSNEVALPSENNHIRMDNNVGTDLLIILYSKDALNLADIQTAYKQQSSRLSPKEKLKAVIGAKLMSDAETTMASNGKISFKGKGKGKSVMALITAIQHVE
jgi:Papain family cysteine protease/Domain of unknown function (DUF4384)